MKLLRAAVTALLLSSAAQALTAQEAGEALRFTPNPEARLCKILGSVYKGVAGYTVERPFFFLKDFGLITVTAQTLIPGGTSTFAPYQSQKWETRENDFQTLTILDKDRKGFVFYFDLRDRYTTDVCIRPL
ncbi:hypothetical protein [uncultured Deinococcus sp.]|uniref:hypothetical protein n=1 Tax=uncultured Deinococcus sp. TaxID=158789 RepID=UPI003749F066